MSSSKVVGREELRQKQIQVRLLLLVHATLVLRQSGLHLLVVWQFEVLPAVFHVHQLHAARILLAHDSTAVLILLQTVVSCCKHLACEGLRHHIVALTCRLWQNTRADRMRGWIGCRVRCIWLLHCLEAGRGNRIVKVQSSIVNIGRILHLPRFYLRNWFQTARSLKSGPIDGTVFLLARMESLVHRL